MRYASSKWNRINAVSLMEWINENERGFELAFGLTQEHTDIKDIKRIFFDLLNLSKANYEFDSVFTVFLYRHYDKLFPDVIPEEGKAYSKKESKVSSGSITIN